MLRAILCDFLRLPDLDVATTCDLRPGRADWMRDLSPRPLTVDLVRSPDEEWDAFRRRCDWADSVLVIAPETDGMLEQRSAYVAACGKRLLGSSAAAVRLCSDKLALAEHWSARDVFTLPTFSCIGAEAEGGPALPMVVKLRDGAGSQGMQLIEDQATWKRWRDAMAARNELGRFLWQPYWPGRALSVGVIVQNGRAERLPLAGQRLSQDGRFEYRGGVLPVELQDRSGEEPGRDRITKLITDALSGIDGLRGYIGVDLLELRSPAARIDRVGHAHDGRESEATSLCAVEINPRLTTSYLGYRRLSRRNLAGLLFPHEPTAAAEMSPQRISVRPPQPADWETGPVEFTADQ